MRSDRWKRYARFFVLCTGDVCGAATAMGGDLPDRLEAYAGAKIENLYVRTDRVDDDSAELTVQVEVDCPGKAPRSGDVVVEICGENFKSAPIPAQLRGQVLKPGKSMLKMPVKNPRLWYPWDLGDQNLYSARVALKDEYFRNDP